MFRVEWGAAIAMTAAIGLSTGARAVDDPAKALIDKPGLTGLTLKDFTAPVELSMPRLSPSGTKLAIVRRVDDVDQILLVNVADPSKATAIYKTGHVSPELAKKKWRRYVSFLDWKTEDSLLVSISGPVGLELGNESRTFDEPIHMILPIDGKSPPVFFNAKLEGKRARVDFSEIENVLPHDPDHVLLTIWPELQSIEVDRVDVHTGKREVLEHGDTDIIEYGSDRKGHIVTRTLERGGGWLTLQGRAPGEKTWTKIVDFRRKEQRELAKYEFLGVGDVGTIYVAAKPDGPADGDTKSVHSFDLQTMKLGPVVWSNPTYDVDDIIQDEETGEIIAGCYWIDTYRCDFTSPRLTANLAGLSKYFKGERNLSIVSKSKDDKEWILFVEGPDAPGTYYIYDVDLHHIAFLGDKQSKLSEARLAKTRRFTFETRDHVELTGYVTQPSAAAQRPWPLVVMPHGGPEVRDELTYDLWVQYLVSRGYVVLQPNFRGSGGFGHKFAEAGYGQWGGRMHEDVMDATKALIAEGKVDPARVCVVGGSYGGYEALYAAAVEPEVFKCAVSVDGVSDLVGNMKFERSFGADSARYAYWVKSQGDPNADAARMLAHSPYRLASGWKTPTLLIHGDQDDIVPIEESRQMKRALEGAGKPVRYIEIEGMGHGPSSVDEWTRVLSEVEAFLVAHIGEAGPSPSTSPTRAQAPKPTL